MEDRTALELRVRALERETRTQRVLSAGALLALAIVLAGDQPGSTAHAKTNVPAPELQARRFVLVGAEGARLGVLEASATGGPQLVLFDREAGARATLMLAADGEPSLALSAAGGRDRVRLVAGSDEARVSLTGLGASAVTLANGGIAPRLALADANGNDRLWVALRLGSPALQFLDARGVARSGLTTFNDEAGVAVVSGSDKSDPGLVLYGKERTILWSAP